MITLILVVVAELLLIYIESKDVILLFSAFAYFATVSVLYEKHKLVNEVEWKTKKMWIGKRNHKTKLKTFDVALIVIACILGSMLGVFLINNEVNLEPYMNAYLLCIFPVLWVIDSVSVTWTYLEKRL